VRTDGAKEVTYDFEKLRWLYDELIRIERHWTEQVRDQQTRIATLLTVSSILLSFLTGAGFFSKLLEQPDRRWPVYVYVLALVSLCCALFMGIRALRPSIPIGGASTPFDVMPEPHQVDWLDHKGILKSMSSLSPEDLLFQLCRSASRNQADANHRRQLEARRRLMLRQFSLLMVSLALLVVALVGILASKPDANPGSRAASCARPGGDGSAPFSVSKAFGISAPSLQQGSTLSV